MSNHLLGKIEIKNTLLLVCDIQEIFRCKIPDFENLVKNIKNLIKVAKILDINIFVSEQYPKVFGYTIEEIKHILPNNANIHDKKKFSMLNDSILDLIKENKIDSVILVGIETHICILQTALELRGLGVNVHIIEDAVSSQHIKDHDNALKRLIQSEIFITRFESLIFQLIKTSNHKNFKEIIKIIKDNSMKN